MAIDKKTPRQLNKSSDAKVRKENEMFDALNVSVSEDGRSGNGNGGVLKPIKSNVQLNMLDNDEYEKYVLGKCIDTKYNVVYFFVHSPNNIDNDGVYAYDPDGYLPVDHDVNDIVTIYRSPNFRFNREMFIKADITYTQQRFIDGDLDYEDTPMLFFTDNVNEPKKLNVLRAITGDGPVVTELVGFEAAELDFITACPKTPVEPPVAEWVNDTTVPGNEFINVEGFQFAYQCVFRDSNESAISTYSDIYVPPGYLRYTPGNPSALMNGVNALNITVPAGDISGEVESVKILGRRGDRGSWFLLKEMTPAAASDGGYLFNNTEINAAIPRDLQTKDFDNLPYRAQAQTIIGNRLMYGNYVENRDPVGVTANLKALPQERPDDFVTYVVSAIHSVVPSPVKNSSGAQNKNIGFVIDTSKFQDETIASGSLISFSATINPRQNFHVYNAKNSYHQSPQMGEDFDNESAAQTVRSHQTNQQSGSLNNNLGQNTITNRPRGFYWQTEEESGAYFMKTMAQNYGRIPVICSDGINKTWKDSGEEYLNSKWKWRSTDMTTLESSPFSPPVDFGTSAANPLIIQGKDITISCSFYAGRDLTAAEVSRALALLLGGMRLSRNEEDPTELDGYAASISPPTEESLSYSFDVGLSDGAFVNETSGIAKLITVVGAQFNKADVLNDFKAGAGTGTDEGSTGFEGGTPPGLPSEEEIDGDFPSSSGGLTDESQDVIKGFFVLNKAEVQFDMFFDETYAEEETMLQLQGNTFGINENAVSERDVDTKNRVGIYVKYIDIPDDPEAVLSCMKRPWPGSKWYFWTPWENPTKLHDPTGWVYKSLYAVPSKDYPGLVNSSEFNEAMGNSIGLYTEGLCEDTIRFSKPMDWGTGGENESGYGSSLSLESENNIYLDAPGANGSVKKAPWANIFGGLLMSSNYTSFQEINDRPIRFFEGEKPSGKSVYSLMDGASGPGGLPIQAKAHYNRYTLYCQNGFSESGRGFGINKLSSAPLFSLTDEINIAIGSFTTHPGVYGPALSNNIVLGRRENGDLAGGLPIPGGTLFNLKSPRYFSQEAQAHVSRDEGDGTGPAFDGSEPTGQQGIYDPICFVTSMPLIHTSKPNPDDPTGGESAGTYIGAFINPDTSDQNLYGNYGKLGATHHDGENDDQVYEHKYTNPNHTNVILYVLPPSVGNGRTFKRGANHAFGVVFYDQRGRASNVHPIGSIHSPWFSETTGLEGAVNMSITLQGEVPDYATHFQIVYAGNTSYSRYLQYSTGGAFIAKDSENGGNIYVSLNYLQDNKISLAKGFGATSVDGSQQIYTFRQGDRLRVINWYETETSRLFADADYEFRIVDQVLLGDGPDNPLYDVDQDGEAPHPAKVGQFLILENNPNANGFTFEDVQLGNNYPNSQSHNWNKRCVVEINTPKFGGDEESLVYYETSNVYPISEFGNTVIMENGDAWWRSVPMNFARIQNTGFNSLIKENSASSNFFPYYVESDRFSYKVTNSDVNGKGKFKIYLPDYQKSYRSSSITYSDENNPASKIFTITSFNPSKGQFKDMPIENGDINYIANNDQTIFVIQSNRCSDVPVNRNVITDLGDNQSLVAARKVLGTSMFYAGGYGCDENPESVCELGDKIYFASKENRQVYRYTRGGGIEVISDAGMKSYFRRLFELAERDELDGLGPVKVVGGYDPEKDSYILSVYNLDDRTYDPAQDPSGDPGTGGGGGEGGGDGPTIVTQTPTSITVNTADLRAALTDAQGMDSNGDGIISTADLLKFLTVFNQQNVHEDIQLDEGDGITFNYD